MPKTYALVIFDWDGTLINSIPRIIACYRHTFREANLSHPSDDEIKETIGLPMDPSLALMFPRLDADERERLISIYRDIWRGDTIAPSPMFEGSTQLMTGLADQGSILAVATGKSREGMEREAGNHAVRHRFQHSRCALETKAKPDPQMLVEIINEARVEPSQALMIGDHVLDLEMARMAGVDAIGVTSGGIARQRLEAQSPLAVLETVADVRGFLEAQP